MKEGVAGTLTLSFWKEWRKFPPSSPSSRGVPGGLLMPLMLLGEFCRERRGGEPRAPTACQPAWEKGFLGVGGPRGGAGWVWSGRRHQTHSLLEVHLCHLTLQGKENPSQFPTHSSVEGPPNASTGIPHYFWAENVPSWQYLSLRIFPGLWTRPSWARS